MLLTCRVRISYIVTRVEVQDHLVTVENITVCVCVCVFETVVCVVSPGNCFVTKRTFC